MDYIEIITSAYQSLRLNLLRTILTMLGIIVGISSVILIASIGQGAVAFITNELSAFGTNYFQIQPGNSPIASFAGGGDPLTMDDVQAIRDENFPNIESIAPFAFTTKPVSIEDEDQVVTIYGLTSEAQAMLQPDIIYGEFITEEYDDSNAKVAAIGIDVAEELFGEDTDPVGESIRIENDRYRVIGVTKSSAGLFGGFFNSAVNVPLSTMQSRIRGDDKLQEIDISVYDTDLINQTMEDVEFLLRDSRGLDDTEENDFQMSSFVDVLSTVQTITGLLTTMIAGISGISLVVGGVGVMNIMLVSVTERTKEIGLLKALGARQRDILAQFLMESVFMTLSGGLIGIFLGISGAFLVSQLASIPFVISLPWITFAVVISTSVGIIFGLYPARRAARLNPIDALRYE